MDLEREREKKGREGGRGGEIPGVVSYFLTKSCPKWREGWWVIEREEEEISRGSSRRL